MNQTLPISISMGALPPAVKWTIQQMADEMAARMTLVTAQTFALFVTGSTAPTSNVGPWLKNGSEWWVWSSTVGTYVPITIAQPSLGYFIGSTAPDETVYQFWIETAASGSPLAVKIYYGGAWVDVYATLLADYQTVAAMAAYYTSAQTDSAISMAINNATNYAGVGTLNALQSVAVDTVYHKMTLDAAQINDDSAINVGLGRYVAPVAGNYHIDVTSQFDNTTGAPASMQIIVSLYKNGIAATEGIGSFSNETSPSGSRWPVTFGGIIALQTNDYIECWTTLSDGVNTGAVNLTTWDFSVVKV